MADSKFLLANTLSQNRTLGISMRLPISTQCMPKLTKFKVYKIDHVVINVTHN